MDLGFLNQLQIFWQLYLRDFNRSGATQTVLLDISKAFDRVWHVGLLHRRKSYGISTQIFCLISSFLSNKQLWVVLDGKSSQEYPVNALVPQGSILGYTLFLPFSYHFSYTFLLVLYVILLSTLMILLSTLNVIRYLMTATKIGFWTWIWPTRH